MFNKVILIGNLTRDPEIRYTPSGTAVAGFGLAVNRKYNSNGQVKEEVYFGEVSVWGKQGENCGKFLKKGSRCLVEGRLSTDSWEANGERKTKTRIIAEQVKFLTPKASGTTGHEPDEFTEEEAF